MMKSGKPFATAARSGSPINDTPPPMTITSGCKSWTTTPSPFVKMPRQGFQQRFRDFVSGLQSLRQMPGFAARVRRHHLGQDGIRRLFHRQANRAIEAPARAVVLQNSFRSVQTQMPKLHLPRRRAMINAPIHHKAAPHPAPHVRVKNRVHPLPRPAHRLAERGQIAVILDEHWQPRLLAQPIAQRKIRPARDVVRAPDAPRSPVHRPAIAHPDRRRLPFRYQFRHRLRNLLANPFRPARPIHIKSPPVHDAPIARAGIKLQFGAPNLNGKKPGRRHRIDDGLRFTMRWSVAIMWKKGPKCTATAPTLKRKGNTAQK